MYMYVLWDGWDPTVVETIEPSNMYVQATEAIWPSRQSRSHKRGKRPKIIEHTLYIQRLYAFVRVLETLGHWTKLFVKSRRPQYDAIYRRQL